MHWCNWRHSFFQHASWYLVQAHSFIDVEWANQMVDFSSEHKMLSEHGGIGRMSAVVSGGVDVLKFWEKQSLSRVALEAGDETGKLSLLMSVGMELTLLLRLLIAFQQSLWEGLRVAKNLFLDALRALVTTFLIFLYLGIREGHTLDLLNRAFLFLIGTGKSL